MKKQCFNFLVIAILVLVSIPCKAQKKLRFTRSQLDSITSDVAYKIDGYYLVLNALSDPANSSEEYKQIKEYFIERFFFSKLALVFNDAQTAMSLYDELSINSYLDDIRLQTKIESDTILFSYEIEEIVFHSNQITDTHRSIEMKAKVDVFCKVENQNKRNLVDFLVRYPLDANNQVYLPGGKFYRIAQRDQFNILPIEVVENHPVQQKQSKKKNRRKN